MADSDGRYTTEVERAEAAAKPPEPVAEPVPEPQPKKVPRLGEKAT